MSNVVNLPFVTIERAREIVENPDLHTAAEIKAACEIILRVGNDEDVRQVRALQRARIIDRIDLINAVYRRRRWQQVEFVWGVAILFLASVGAVSVVAWLVDMIRAVLS